LPNDFPLVCDFEDLEMREPGGFMPNQEGSWFEQIRIRCEGASLGKVGVSAVDSFYHTLSWFAVNDLRGLYQMLQSSAALARGIQYSDLLRLLGSARPQDELLGWSLYWRGSAEADLQKCAKLLRAAFGQARKQNDSALASEVCLELGKVYSRSGAYQQANEVCTMAQSIADEVNTNLARSNANWLKGTILAHWTNQPIAFEFLERSEELCENNIQRAIARSSRAFYLVSSGQLDAGKEVLEWSLETASQLGHRRIDIVNGMTQAVLGAFGESRNRAVRQLESMIETSRANGTTQMRVYAEELLGRLFLLDGDRGLAAGCMDSAKTARIESNMIVTPLEATRVQSLV
jgi:tetratricopeptide (TPR) repeat protein